MAAFGFRPLRYTNGNPWNGGTVRCSVLSGIGNIFIGDTVILAGTTSISSVDGAILNDIALCAAGNRTYGVVQAILPAVGTPNLNITYGATGAYREVLVVVADHNLVFETTCDEAIVVTGASAVQGTCYNIVATAGSTTTGASGHVLDATGGSTSENTWLLIGVKNDPGNLATVGSVTATYSVISTASNPTILEAVCVEPQVFPTQVGAGV
jgi:hypothetical protein